jgi:AraC-like DNA-binding protein
MIAALTRMCHRLSMDALAGLLDGPRARRAFLVKAVFSPPWSIDIEDRAPLSVAVVTRGTAVLTGSSGPATLALGDVLLARGPTPYTVSDDAETPSDIRILPGQACVDPQGHLLDQTMSLGVRTWGNTVAGSTVMLIGTYAHETEIGARVLGALPDQLVVPALDSPVVDLLAAEIDRDGPGQEAVLDRLLDLLLVTCLRRVFSGESAEVPTWYAAQDDPVVGKAIGLIHHHVAHPWSVESLAEACGLSRAAFARRFTALVGEPPMAFLTGWRLALAADLLAAPDATLASVARQVGYGSAFSLSAAFKRRHGLSPRTYLRSGVMVGAG